MDDNTLLLLITALYAAIFGARLILTGRVSRAGNLGWKVLTGGILAGCGICYALDYAGGLYLFIAFMLLVLAPNILITIARRMALRARFRTVHLLCRLASVLHPLDGLPAMARMAGANAMAASGNRQSAAAVLQTIVNDTGVSHPTRNSAMQRLMMLRRDWAGLAALPPGDMGAAYRVIGAAMQGEPGAMLANYASAEQVCRRLGPAFAGELETARLYVLALSGQEAATARLLDGPMAVLPSSLQRIWRDVARLAALRPVAGTVATEAGATRLMASCRTPLERNLAEVLTAATPMAPLSLAEQAVLQRIAHAEQARPHAVGNRVWLTWAIVAACCAMFGAEMLAGGSTDSDTLFALGALDPLAVALGHQYWRLLAAMFLHAGPLHLGFNMMALVALGPPLERRLGWLRFGAVYFGAGLLSMAAVVVLNQYGVIHDDLLVGASGAIMGVLGANIGVFLRTPKLARQAADLRWVLLVLVMQAGLDQMVPQISGAAHIAGAASGMLVALVLPYRRLSGLAARAA